MRLSFNRQNLTQEFPVAICKLSSLAPRALSEFDKVSS